MCFDILNLMDVADWCNQEWGKVALLILTAFASLALLSRGPLLFGPIGHESSP